MFAWLMNFFSNIFGNTARINVEKKMMAIGLAQMVSKLVQMYPRIGI